MILISQNFALTAMNSDVILKAIVSSMLLNNLKRFLSFILYNLYSVLFPQSSEKYLSFTLCLTPSVSFNSIMCNDR